MMLTTSQITQIVTTKGKTTATPARNEFLSQVKRLKRRTARSGLMESACRPRRARKEAPLAGAGAASYLGFHVWPQELVRLGTAQTRSPGRLFRNHHQGRRRHRSRCYWRAAHEPDARPL